MKLIKIIKKNIKLLIRSKSSAFIVIFGPLLIIILVGLALNKPTNYDLSIGYSSPDSNNSLTQSFIKEIESNNYIILKYDSKELCVEAIKNGVTNMCILFPLNFKLGINDSNKVIFYADYSRANLVYQIIGSVSEKFNLRTSEISKDLTQILITKIAQSKQEIDKNILSIISLKSSISNVDSLTDDTKKKTSEINFTMPDLPLKIIKTKGHDVFSDTKDLKDEGLSAITEGRTFADGLSNTSTSSFKNSLTEIESNINTIYNTTPDTINLFDDIIDNTTAKINKLKTQLSDGNKANNEVINKLENIKTLLMTLKSDSNNLKINLEKINSDLEKIDVASAEDIVSPIRTEIKPIASNSNQLVFMFPYLLTLIIMFIGIMLSSALIMMEKSSKAFFRNYTTPTKKEFFIITTYLTSFILLVIQIFIIIILAYFVLNNQIFENYLLTSLILLLTISIFILLGMIIGYFSGTQESATMLSISIGSILLLLSNLILPIESMSITIKSLVKLNPYVVSSELLRKSILFKLTFSDSLNGLIFLAITTIILIILVFIINELSRSNFLKKGLHFTSSEKIYLPEDSYLTINNKIIKNKKDLLELVENINDEDFEKHTKDKNEFSEWVTKTLKERMLGWRLKSKNKNKMIKALRKNIEKEDKKKKHTK